MVEMLVGCSGINFTEARIKIVGIMSLEILSLARNTLKRKNLRSFYVAIQRFVENK